MPVKSFRKKQAVLIEATGSLGVEQSGELLEALIKAVGGKEKKISIDLSGVTESDITCLQLICSAHKSALNSGKAITISKISPELLQTVADTGLTEQNDCASEMSGSCPWNIKGGAI